MTNLILIDYFIKYRHLKGESNFFIIQYFPHRYPDGTVKLRNPNIELMDQDILYHLALGSGSHDLPEMFGDVKVRRTHKLVIFSFLIVIIYQQKYLDL